jgi:pimeloyl-ACP methyl ester carboxylesterase
VKVEKSASSVRSADGTSIAYNRQGGGPAVILVGGGLDDGSENAPLAAELAKQFTVYNYARRGRGDSGDTLPYALEREIEDIEALIANAGGSAHLYGVSTGGALALEAAAAGLAIDKLAVYEVPYDMAEDWPQKWPAYVEELAAVLAEGRRADALELFMRLAGSSDDEIAAVRDSPYWSGMEGIAHTLAYDAACLGNGQPSAASFAAITQPTLVVTGDERPPNSARWVLALDEAADALVASMPNAKRLTLDGQGHVADPVAVVGVLGGFFGE